MKIVDSKHHILTNYKKGEAVSSDHAPMLMEVKLEALTEKKQKVEIPNFEDKNLSFSSKRIHLRQKCSHSALKLCNLCANTVRIGSYM